MRNVVQVAGAALIGAFVVLVLMTSGGLLGPVSLTVDGRGIDLGLALVALAPWVAIGLVVVDESFSRRIEAALASWRDLKAAGSAAWASRMKEEAHRLSLE